MNSEEILKEIINKELDKEISDKPTFTEEMAETIRNVYKELIEKRKRWLCEKRNANSSKQ